MRLTMPLISWVSPQVLKLQAMQARADLHTQHVFWQIDEISQSWPGVLETVPGLNALIIHFASPRDLEYANDQLPLLWKTCLERAINRAVSVVTLGVCYGQNPGLQPQTLGSADALSGKWCCAHRQQPNLELDRPWALGRSNWLFAGSLRSGKRAAAIISLIQSARLNGHDPYAYLKDVLLSLPTQRASETTELLPHKWASI